MKNKSKFTSILKIALFSLLASSSLNAFSNDEVQPDTAKQPDSKKVKLRTCIPYPICKDWEHIFDWPFVKTEAE